ncbi:MAG: damage-control phosphatase ARMT1 family protein [Bacillota bacterium]
MKCAAECAVCAVNGLNRILNRFVPDEKDRIHEMQAMLKYLYEFDYAQSPPQILRYLCNITPRLTGGRDGYAEQRSIDNQNMLKKYDDFFEKVRQHPDPLRAAVLLAICGNIIDYTPSHGLDMDTVVQNAMNSDLTIDHVDEMLRVLSQAENVLYLLDNAGEIVADKLLLELLIEKGILKPNQVTAVVRGLPTLNDATMEDAREVGLTGLVNVIGNGDNVPGTELDHCSQNFIEHYEKADVVIAKGMGNFESLHHIKDKKIFFLLTSKCNNVTRALGVPLQSFVCKASYL